MTERREKQVEAILDQSPSDEKINELADFFNSLNIHQLLFLKDCYESWVVKEAKEVGNGLVH
jgi:uncharacterized protein (DUF433 family)